MCCAPLCGEGVCCEEAGGFGGDRAVGSGKCIPDLMLTICEWVHVSFFRARGVNVPHLGYETVTPLDNLLRKFTGITSIYPRGLLDVIVAPTTSTYTDTAAKQSIFSHLYAQKIKLPKRYLVVN